jgi:hypothetical protein
MLKREACERRVYRLATLLTGDPVAATRVIEAVVDAQPDLRKLDNARMDRLTVLRSREITPATLVAEGVGPRVTTALSRLGFQHREAWVFTRVYQLTPREAARAMDCSVTAMNRHLQMADSAMRGALGDQVTDAAERLLRYTMSLDVPAFYRARKRRRRWLRGALWALAGAVVIAALAVAGTILSGHADAG